MDFINWLIASSEDPNKVSLFIKSLVTFAVLFGVDATFADTAAGYLISIISATGMGIAAVMGIWGLFRKVKNGQWSAK